MFIYLACTFLICTNLINLKINMLILTDNNLIRTGSNDYIASNIAATPIPPAVQIEIRPRPFPF
jgi:hypothetical protein